ncbi:hypothetical protein [Geothermobacter hydrogeniphilus]|uniref:hypothetical protein n=1 Tax=Geothermobacter hydrogeniphilus TaxID=1969733 RepID=UPI00111C22AC|nr:hypothetical protein [Geothermobacter hydrogeniphilus]
MQMQQREMLQREINYLLADMSAMVGLPDMSPKYPESRTIIHTGGTTLNNIHVTNSEIGVLNTGTIQSMDGTVTILKSDGNPEIATAVTSLSEAIIKSAEISTNQKNQILELITSIAEEVVAPKEKRKTAVAKALLSELSTVLGGITSLSSVWESSKQLFEQFFQ